MNKIIVNFRILFLTLGFCIIWVSTAYSDFTAEQCLNSSFNVILSKKAFYWGPFQHQLIIKKNACTIEISKVRYQYSKSKWNIDVCRSPVHIKEGTEVIDVYEKTIECSKLANTKTKNEYCGLETLILRFIQQEGLIFAKGQRNDLNSDHGKVYCSYFLVEKYLSENKIFGFEMKDIPGEEKSTQENSANAKIEELVEKNENDILKKENSEKQDKSKEMTF